MGDIGVTSMDQPSFTRAQIVKVTDVQRKWKTAIEGKLAEQPFLVMFSGAEPKTAMLSYEKFEELWRMAQKASELELQLELLRRTLAVEQDRRELSSLSSVMEKAGITIEELEAAPDVDLEID